MKKNSVKGNTIKSMTRMLGILLLFIAIWIQSDTVYADNSNIVFSNITSNSVHVDWSGVIKEYQNSVYQISSVKYVFLSLDKELYIKENATETSADFYNLQEGEYYNFEMYLYKEDGDWFFEYNSFNTPGTYQFLKETTGVVVVPGNSSLTEVQQPGVDVSNKTPRTPAQSVAPQPVVSQPQPTISKPFVTTPSVDMAVLIDGTAYITAKNYGNAEGLEFRLCDKKTNKVVATDSNFNSPTITFYNVKENKIYYVQVRAFQYDSSYQKVYSGWSGKKYMVAQPSIKLKKSAIKQHSLNLKWNKVTGASKYTIYARKRNAKKWIKITTTKKTNYKLTKLKGKTIDVHVNDYEVTIVANAKIGGKNYKSDNSKYIYTYTHY